MSKADEVESPKVKIHWFKYGEAGSRDEGARTYCNVLKEKGESAIYKHHATRRWALNYKHG